jgi:hypothetical protein
LAAPERGGYWYAVCVTVAEHNKQAITKYIEHETTLLNRLSPHTTVIIHSLQVAFPHDHCWGTIRLLTNNE